MPEHPAFAAVKALDVEALRRELAAGVDPDMYESDHRYADTLLLQAVRSRRHAPEAQMRERLEIISLLLEAGASVDLVASVEQTPLHHAAHSESQAYHVVIAALLEAGADVNYVGWGGSVLASAAKCGTAGAVRMLISAGAVDLDRALVLAIEHGKQRSCAPLMRAGAAIPAVLIAPKPACSTPWEELVPTFSQTRAYVGRVRATGGFKAYEKAHRQRLTAVFLPKFPPVLPVEMLERVLEFTWDIGGH
jgi:hypothetical protein